MNRLQGEKAEATGPVNVSLSPWSAIPIPHPGISCSARRPARWAGARTGRRPRAGRPRCTDRTCRTSPRCPGLPRQSSTRRSRSGASCERGRGSPLLSNADDEAYASCGHRRDDESRDRGERVPGATTGRVRWPGIAAHPQMPDTPSPAAPLPRLTRGFSRSPTQAVASLPSHSPPSSSDDRDRAQVKDVIESWRRRRPIAHPLRGSGARPGSGRRPPTTRPLSSCTRASLTLVLYPLRMDEGRGDG